MSYSPALGSAFNDTQNKSKHISSESGMCSLCSADCNGPCEIGLSAVLGAKAVYPTNTGENQVASEKNYPIGYSHFNINGRVFGAMGIEADPEKATIFNVKLENTYGTLNPVKVTMPIMLPALIKLNWKDYFGGAAMAGVSCVIGEGAQSKDPSLKMENGKITEFPMLTEMLDCFNKYYRGYGQIILQCNVEDDAQGLADIAVEKYGVTALEFKFGQAAKGIQPVIAVSDYDTALAKKKAGVIIHPDPEDPEVVAKHNEGIDPNFFSYARLPMWDEHYLVPHIEELRRKGLKNVYFKMAGYDPEDLEHVLRIAAAAKVDMVTFDGAGGGSGYSPVRMMNEWGRPAIMLETALIPICNDLESEGLEIPAITLTGGFSTEDQVFKALALGSPYITHIGLCRATMAAAMTGKTIGDAVAAGNVPAHLKKYGTTKEELFLGLKDLRCLYGKEADEFSTGAIGVYSYLSRIALGIRHFGALNRKFDVKLFDRNDLIPLTQDACDLLDEAEDIFWDGIYEDDED